MDERVGIAGLGVMGSAMAANLVDAGVSVSGFDIDEARLESAGALGVEVVSSITQLADSAEVIVLSLPSVDALEQVTGELSRSERNGHICLETGTLPLSAKNSAKEELLGAGIELMDVPLSGTGLQAADGTLVVFASGSEAAFLRCKGVFDAIGRSTHYLGEFGNGSRMKYIANLLVAVHTLAAAEAHALGAAAAMDPALVQQVMEDGVGSSKMLEIRGPMMVAGEYPAAARLDIILKDARLIRDFALDSGALTPLLDVAVDVYAEASDAGLGDLDAAALFRFLREKGGLQR